MKRNYCESLSRKQLKDWGFTQIVYYPSLFGKFDEDPKKDWYIERLWQKNSSKQPVLKRINVTEAICKHKYSADKKY
jgi:starvation-inducible outer membrane lipoprotein